MRKSLSSDLFCELSDSAASAHVVKSAFLANMSHEMRTPLTVILGFADILKRPALSDELRNDYLGRIERSGQQLLSLIEDLLDLAKIEAGQLSVRKEATDFRQIVESVLSKHMPSAAKKNLVLESFIDEALPNSIESSPLRFKQILDNLVSNAVKFTELGSVQVLLRRDRDLLLIDVVDTGIGIDDDLQETLFQPFSQADNSRTRSQGGTGIGLILSKRLTELLGGELNLKQSRKAVGTVFTVTLPGLGDLPMASDSAQKTSNDQLPLENVRLLVAEDVLDNQDLFRIVLESAGAEVHIVANGEEAVKQATTQSFDAILMDVQMPLLDGLSATKKIRAAGATLPIIALTAHAMPEEVAKSKAAGCDDHVSKPISANTLISAVLRHLHRAN
jgi:CheY-like chemotaxis protein/two-component sensor histidine kinase